MIFLLSGVLVGLPAGLGTYLALAPREFRAPSAGATLLFYAALLAAVFVLILPDGKLAGANYRVQMPAAFVGGLVLGALGAWVRHALQRGSDR